MNCCVCCAERIGFVNSLQEEGSELDFLKKSGGCDHEIKEIMINAILWKNVQIIIKRVTSSC